MNRSDAVEVLPELITLVRTPYERLASTLPEQIAADYSGRINLLPRGLVSSLRACSQRRISPIGSRHAPHYGGGDPPRAVEAGDPVARRGGAADAGSGIDRVDQTQRNRGARSAQGADGRSAP